MSKAVLVLDEMPTECFKCKLCQFAFDSDLFEEGEAFCVVEGKSVENNLDNGSKPNWCPLRELPEKKQERDASEYEFGILGKGFEQGWNVCINEITGKTEGKND